MCQGCDRCSPVAHPESHGLPQASFTPFIARPKIPATALRLFSNSYAHAPPTMTINRQVVAIAGGTGGLGCTFVDVFQNDFEVIVLTHKVSHGLRTHASILLIPWLSSQARTAKRSLLTMMISKECVIYSRNIISLQSYPRLVMSLAILRAISSKLVCNPR